MIDKGMLLRAIKDGNFRYKIMTSIYGILGYSNRNLSALEVRYRVYRYLKKHYQKELDHMDFDNDTVSDADCGKNNIWICWWQGIDYAPELVKKCVESVFTYMPDKEIHIITRENYQSYVKFPAWITEKWEKGIISDTKISNMLRLELLIQYGGVWMDATVLLTGRIPEWVYQNNLFFFSTSRDYDITRIYNNYFMYAARGQRFMKALCELHYIFWKKENKVHEYFLWHLFANMCAEKYAEDLKGIYFIPDNIVHLLSHSILEPFDERYWKEVTKVTNIHKLSWKIDISGEKEGTYYDYILNEI